MILSLVLASWILALAVVAGLCIAAGRGDAALHVRLAEEPGVRPRRPATPSGTPGERRPHVAGRRAEHDRGRAGRVAVG
jgi:hypothetical protein